DVLSLNDGEKVRAVTRRHVATLVPPLGLALILIVAPFFLLFPLFSWGTPGVVLFCVAIVLGILIAIRSVVLWDAGALILTTMHISDVDQKGLLTRTVSEASLTSIQDVSWGRNGFADTIFRMGKITIQTASTTATIEARRIPHPEQMYELINELRHGVPA